MGSGRWSTSEFASYTCSTKAVNNLSDYETKVYSNVQSLYHARRLSDKLNAANKIRECRDSDEHPNTLPVILAIDVTGSMGSAAMKVAQKLNQIMTDLYANDSIQDIEFCVMGIGDLYCDDAPIQMSQFESDVRIAEQLDELYFEGGGGGNSFESYTAAWYMGVNHCDLDCWKRGKKGIIITLGDEMPNPYLPKDGYSTDFFEATGDNIQDQIETKDLIEEAREKFDLFHISVNDSASSYEINNRRHGLDEAWKNLLGEENYFVSKIESLPQVITNIIISREENTFSTTPIFTGEDLFDVDVVTW